MLLSANTNLVPFGQAQAWAVGNATLPLLLPVTGKSPHDVICPPHVSHGLRHGQRNLSSVSHHESASDDRTYISGLFCEHLGQSAAQ